MNLLLLTAVLIAICAIVLLGMRWHEAHRGQRQGGWALLLAACASGAAADGLFGLLAVAAATMIAIPSTVLVRARVLLD